MANNRWRQIEKAKEQMNNYYFRKCIWTAIGGCMLNVNDTPGKITLEDFEKIKAFFNRIVIRGEGNARKEEKA